MNKLSAIGIVETSSISKCFEIADTILKTAAVDLVVNRTICPGKYMVVVGGDVDAVREVGPSDAARDVGDEPLLISMLVRTAIANMAVQGIERALGQCELPPKGLRQLRDELAAEMAEPVLRSGLVGERAAGLCLFTCSRAELRQMGSAPLVSQSTV